MYTPWSTIWFHHKRRQCAVHSKFSFQWFWRTIFRNFLLRCPSQSSARSQVPSQVVTYLESSQLWAGKTPDLNPGLQDNSLARYHWATMPLNYVWSTELMRPQREVWTSQRKKDNNGILNTSMLLTELHLWPVLHSVLSKAHSCRCFHITVYTVLVIIRYKCTLQNKNIIPSWRKGVKSTPFFYTDGLLRHKFQGCTQLCGNFCLSLINFADPITRWHWAEIAMSLRQVVWQPPSPHPPPYRVFVSAAILKSF